MKTSPQLMIFKLSALSTLLLCSTANNYASDIEIYRAPTAADGKARIMLNIDNSSFMTAEPGGFSGGKTSITEDFGDGITCPNGSKKYQEQSSTRTYNGISYTDNEYFCTTPAPVPASAGNLKKDAIERYCELSGSSYKCFDRYTMVRRSLYNIVNSTELGDKVSIGISTFPAWRGTVDAVQRPIPLGWYKVDPSDNSKLINCPSDSTTGCTYGRNVLNSRIHNIAAPMGNGDVSQNKNVPVAKGYGVAAKTLLTNEIGGDLTTDQCSGYGIFTLTSGLPDGEELPSARSNIRSILQSTAVSSLTECPDNGDGPFKEGAWKCIGQAAELLAAGKAKITMPVKSAVVSFGTSFSFSPDLSAYDPKMSTAQQIKKVTDENTAAATNNEKALYANKGYAAISGVKGEGGYYSVQDTNALTDTVKRFIGEVAKVDIPYLTTGAPTIPQDPLNPALVQNKAYYSQFKPTPSAIATSGSQLWLGNLKKYRINDLGEIIAKSDVKVLDSLGRLVNGTYDYWAPSVSADTTTAAANENTPGSELYARKGGVWSQLPLGTSNLNNITVENRKLLTNRVVSTTGTVSEGTTLTAIKRTDYDTNGAAVNDPKKTDILQLLDLRQVGAIMHSSPLLLSNKGKVNYDSTTDALSTTNREDYILFGSTQGLLHVVKADDYTSTNGGGKEVFAFVPHEMIEKQNKAFPTPDQATGGTANLFYGIDGLWTAYTEYVVDSSGNLTVGTGKAIDGSGTTLQGKQMVYGGLRMGGRSYYALNLSDMASPALAFHIDPKDQKVYYKNSSKVFSELQYMGQSWSKPKIAWVKWGGTRKLVMFVGGGYDPGYESENYNQDTNTTNPKRGAGVYMFDALNGDLLWWASDNATAISPATATTGVIALKNANLKYSVVSEIKTADRNNDGLVDNLYFGDLGGQVFRVDINNNASTIGAFATRVVRLLNVRETSGEKSPRFYAAPGFSIYKDKDSGKLFAAISIGSGNLSRPLVQYTSSDNRPYDALYTIYDKDVTRANLYTDVAQDTQDVSTSLTAIKKLNEITDTDRFSLNADSPVAPYSSSYGWYYKFKGDSTSKPVQQEKLFYSPTVIDNDLYISSYDSDKLGLTGTCGGGVQGESKVRLFCMPFGQCLQSRGYTVANSISKHGPGIQNHAIGGTGGTEGGTTRLIGGAILDNNLDDKYQTKIKFISQRWYERY